MKKKLTKKNKKKNVTKINFSVLKMTEEKKKNNLKTCFYISIDAVIIVLCILLSVKNSDINHLSDFLFWAICATLIIIFNIFYLGIKIVKKIEDKN